MLEQYDIEAIEACVTRPNSVWEAIKSIITAEKYTWYLESLAKVPIKPDIAKRKAKWDSLDTDARSEYMETDAYDEDLKKVLQQVANVLGGFNAEDDDFKVGTKIPIWKRAETMQRVTAFKAAIAFRLTIEETRQLLFTVLEDDEQMDFNPRLPNEMIYAYAIINGLSMNLAQNKDNVEEPPQTSVQAMLYKAKLQFLEILFGGENAICFPKLIEVADSYFNILDSVNMTKAALFLAAIKTSSVDVLLKNIADEIKEDSSQTDEETTQTERRPKLLPDVSVMQRCYEYVSNDQEDEFYVEGVAKPVFEKAQISKVSCLRALKYVSSILETAPNLVDQSSKVSARRVAIYCDMKDFIEKCIELMQNLSEKSMFSASDFLEIFGKSNLGQYTQSEFTAMIDNIIIDNLDDDWRNPRDESENDRVSSYHGDRPQINGDQAKYFRFFFDALTVAFRDLRAVTTRGCQELWATYVEMNRILAYPYFNEDGVGTRLWAYEQMVNKCRSDNTGKFEYTYTVEKLQYNMDDAEDMPSPTDYIANLLSDVDCFAFFNQVLVSRGINEFVSGLDKEGEGKLIGRTGNPQSGCNSLFLLQEDGTFTQDDGLKSFYHYSRFQKQYYVKTIAYSRSDILKLAFWDFLSRKRKKKYNPRLGPTDFIKFFAKHVARYTCCANINKSNSLDRFLLLCLEHEDPVLFLKEAIAYQKTLPKKESKNFWKMLR